MALATEELSWSFSITKAQAVLGQMLQGQNKTTTRRSLLDLIHMHTFP